MAVPAFEDLVDEVPAFDSLVDEEKPSFDALVDDVPKFDDLVDEPVVPLTPEQLAQSQAAGLATLDMLTLPAQFDWSQVNEKLDQQRFAEYLDLNRQADELQKQDPSQSLNPNSPANELRRKAFGIQQQMSPDTQAGRRAASIESGAREASAQGMLEEQTPRETFRTPFNGLSQFLGPGLSSTVLPTVEAAGRQAGAAAGGALAAAKFIPHPGANLIAQIGLPILSSFMGSQVGGAVQEQITQATETPEETQQRQQRTTEAIRANPGANLMGGAFASGPFFGPSLAQFARASRGDIGALRNIGIAGTIGGGMAALQGGKPEDIAAGVFLNAFMNEPTKLGRRLGLTPSFEQQAAETAAAHSELPPLPLITGESDAQQISQASPPDGGVRPSQIAPQDVSLPAAQGSEGVQPGRPGEPLAQGTPTEAREVIPPLQEIIPAITVEGQEVVGRPGDEHLNIFDRHFEGRPEDEKILAKADFDAPKRNPNYFVDAAGNKISREQLKQWYGVSSSQELRALQIAEAKKTAAAVKPSADEARVAELVKAGLTEEEARAGIARAKAEDVLPAQTQYEKSISSSKTQTTPEGVSNLPSQGTPQTLLVQKVSPIKPTAPQLVSKIDKAPDAECFNNARKYAGSEALEQAGAVVVHGKVTTKEGKRIDHAWVEVGDEVHDPTLGEVWKREDYYSQVAADPEARYTPTQANVNMIRAKNQGPWTSEEVGKRVTWRKPSEQISPETQTGTVPPPPSTGEPVARGGGEPTGATSIKNVVTAEERAARGIPPVEQVVRRGNEEVWDAVKAEVAQNPTAPDAVLAELKQKPRALTDREDFLILHRQIELQKAFDAAAAEVNRAAEAGDEPARAEALTRLNGTRDALQEIYDLGKKGGTETARGLAARRAMANADFTLAPMEMRLRAEQGGNPLTEAQAAKVKEQADIIAKTQAEMERIRVERDALKAQQEAAKKEDAAVEPRVKSLADRIIARLDVSAANATKSLRSRLRNLGSAPDPLIVLDVAKIAAAKMAKGAIEFAQWSADMIQEFGEKVRPFLQKGWDQREQFLDAEVSRVTKTRKERSAAEKEASAVKARITSLANRTVMLQERTAKGDFSPMRKPPLDLSKNPEWVKAKAANDAAKTAYEKSRYEARRAQRTTQQKVKDTVGDVLAASRTVLASTDISAPGRQGIFFALPDLFTNPVRLGRQLTKMFRSQFSESKFQDNKAQIESRENAENGLYESSELYLADIDHKPSAREEQFKSELAEKIPLAGRVIRGSNRGFVAFLNTMRADAFDAFVKWSGGSKNVNPETAKFLAMAVNDLTGRGNVSSRRAQGALEWLARYLFSPRLWVSRFNAALAKPVWRDPFNQAISPRARAVVLGQYIKFLGAVGALKWLAGLWGGKMEEDPRDSDFGKLQFGSKRYDVMGGIGNMVTFLSRFATGKTKDDKGKLLRLAWDDEKRPERELMQVVGQHLRNKLAPIPGALYDLRYGRHPDRSKVTPTSLLQQTTVPITVSDTAGFLQRDNPAAALRDTLINALGVAVKDYRK